MTVRLMTHTKTMRIFFAKWKIERRFITMKKVLSMILAIAMIMSLFCAIPVTAAESVQYSSAKLPYFFCDFENNITALPGGTVNVEEEGRGYVAKLSATQSSGDVEIASNVYDKCHINYNLTAGDHISVGMWIKLSKPLKAGSTIRLLFWDDALAPTTQKSVYANIPDVTSTDWQYASGMEVFGSDYTFGKISFRVGNNTNNQAADDTYEIDYLIDELEIKIEKGTANPRATAWAGTSSVDGWDQYAADGIRIGKATMVGPSGAEVTVAQYQGKEDYVTSGGACAMYKGGSGNQKATINAGDEVRVTMWIHNDKAFASQAYHVFKIGDKTFQFPIPMEAGWHRIDQTIVNDTDVLEESAAYQLFGAINYDRRTVVKAEDGTYPVLSVFDYRIYIKGVDKAYVKENERHTHSGSGYVAYWGNGMAISGKDGITTTQHDGTEGLVSEVKANGEPDKFNQIYNVGGGGHKFKHAPGDVIKVSAWVKLPAPAAANKIYYSVFNLTESIILPINGKSTNWQYIEGSMIATKDHENIYYHSFSTSNVGEYVASNSKTWPKDADGNCISIYVDDYKLTVSTPSVSATQFPVADLSFAALTADGLRTDYKTFSKSEVEMTEGVITAYKLIGADSGRSYATVYNAALMPTEIVTDNDETLVLEVVPTANGFAGNPARIALTDVSAFNGIEILDATANSAKISTDRALVDATLVWVAYTTESGKPVMMDIATATINAPDFSVFEMETEVDFDGYSFVKVFLWENIASSAKPLAADYEY